MLLWLLFLWKFCWMGPRQPSRSAPEWKSVALGSEEASCVSAASTTWQKGSVVGSLVNAQLVHGFERNGRWEKRSLKVREAAASWRRSGRKTLIGQVSAFPLQNLICLRIQLQIDSITPYTTTVSCTAHIQILFIGLFTKQVVCTRFSLQCNVTFFQQTRYKKKFFKLTSLVQIWLKLNKEATDVEGQLSSCLHCLPARVGPCAEGKGRAAITRSASGWPLTPKVPPGFGKLCWNSSRI